MKIRGYNPDSTIVKIYFIFSLIFFIFAWIFIPVYVFFLFKILDVLGFFAIASILHSIIFSCVTFLGIGFYFWIRFYVHSGYVVPKSFSDGNMPIIKHRIYLGLGILLVFGIGGLIFSYVERLLSIIIIIASTTDIIFMLLRIFELKRKS